MCVKWDYIVLQQRPENSAKGEDQIDTNQAGREISNQGETGYFILKNK